MNYEKKKKSLRYKDPKKLDILLEFLVLIKQNLHLRKRKEYLELMSMLLANEITTEEFSCSFSTEYDETKYAMYDMEENFEKNFDELSNLLLEKHKKNQIGVALMFMYDYCDDYSDVLSSMNEIKLKDYVKTVISQLKQL